MPVTAFQHRVLEVIVANRSALSHFAGGMVLHAGEHSARYSHDFDIFHEAAEQVALSSEQDVNLLREAGFEVKPLSGDWERPTSFRKALVSRDDESVEIDWAEDSAFRFFPIERDPLLGWRLHLFDMATNKALALAARTETRDYVDIVELHKIYPLAAIIWAACGKDEGFSPLFLLNMMRRFARLNPAKLDIMKARNLDPQALKRAWIEMSDVAEAEIVKLADTQPEMPIGVAFVNAAGVPGWIGTDPSLKMHRPCIQGCLPVVDGLEPECYPEFPRGEI
jgi:hypothetical protein